MKASEAVGLAPHAWAFYGPGMRFLVTFFEALGTSGVRYAVLRNHATLPAPPDGDLDLLVHPDDRTDYERVLVALSRDFSATTIERHTSTSRHQLSLLIGGQTVQLDAQHDFRYHDIVYAKAGPFLARSRADSSSIMTLDPVDEAALTLIHSLLSRKTVQPKYRPSIHAAASAEPSVFLASLQVLVGDVSGPLASAVAAQDWNAVEQVRTALLRHLRTLDPGAALREARSRLRGLTTRVRRTVHPKGSFVVLLGPHGAGKTTSANALRELAEAARQRVEYRHINSRPGVLFNLTRQARAAGQAAAEAPAQHVPDVPVSPLAPTTPATWRSRLKHTLRLGYHVADYVVFYATDVLPHIRDGHVYISDRYYYDYLIEPRGVAHSPYWLRRVLAGVVPRPQVLVLLSNDPETIHARKPELTVAELYEQFAGFKPIVERYHGVTVRTDQLPEAVAREIAEHIFPITS
ncbi:MAG: thymidylate kinase [Myxococcota bacterium]|jgi:thymidylate kinase